MSFNSHLIPILLLLGVAYCQYTPLFAWSDNIQFSKESNGAVNGHITDYSEIKNYISSLLKNGHLDDESIDGSMPEIIVIYLKSELSSNDLGQYAKHFDTFRKLLKESQYSLTIPFLKQLHSPSFESLLSEINSYNTTVYYFGENLLTSQTLNSNIHVINSLENHPILSNGKVDLLIIPIENIAEMDKGKRIEKEMDTIKNMNDIIRSLTNGKFVSIFTGSNQHQIFSSNQKRDNFLSDADGDDDDKEYDWSEYLLKAWFWEGLGVVFIFLFVVITVNISFLRMQTPDRFSKYQVDIKE